MFRKITTLIVTVVVVFSVLPALSAFAAVASTAEIVSGNLTVFPDGIADTFQIRVDNNSDSAVLGLGGSDQMPVNAVQITFPPGVDVPACGVNDGWNCSTVDRGATNRVVFTVSGANLGIMEGESFAFAFDGTVLSPGSRDRSEAFQVQASDNGGNNFANASATGAGLTITTKVLQLLNQSLNVLNPDLLDAPGAEAARSTTGQVASVSFSVRSYAADPVEIDPSISTAKSDTVRAQAANQTANPDQTVTFTYLVDLGGNAATRSANVTVSAANAQDSNTNTGNAALPLTVEREVTLAAAEGDLSPRRVAEGVVSDSFTLLADKDELQGVNNLSGSITFSNDAGVQFTSLLESPATLPRPNANDIPLTFAGIQFSVPGLDDELVLDAAITLSGTDDNGKPFSQPLSLNDVLTIDALAPVINLDDLSIVSPERRQERPNGQDSINISGNVQNAADVANGPGFTVAVTVAGTRYDVPATLSGNGETKTFDVDFSLVDRAAGSFGTAVATVSAMDSASNVGDAEDSIEFDALAPRLGALALALVDPSIDSDPVIQVAFVEDFAEPTVRGACSPLQWDVDNANVTEVRFSDGTRCDAEVNDRGIDNVRILVLDREIDVTNAGTVTYRADGGVVGVGSDPAFDSANNRPLEDLARFIQSAVQPPAPIIDFLTRSNITGESTEDGRETMGFNDGAWQTNVAGADTAVFLDPQNIVNIYSIRIFKDGVAVANVTANANNNPDRKVTGLTPNTCANPCAGQDTVFQAALVASDPRGGELVSELTPFTVRYDTAIPTIADAAATYGADIAGNSPDTVTVFYSEDLADGQNSALDWSALTYNDPANRGDANNLRAYGVNGVSDGDDLNQRDLEVDFNGDTNFAGAEFFNFDSFTYEDFAGNFTSEFTQYTE